MEASGTEPSTELVIVHDTHSPRGVSLPPDLSAIALEEANSSSEDSEDLEAAQDAAEETRQARPRQQRGKGVLTLLRGFGIITLGYLLSYLLLAFVLKSKDQFLLTTQADLLWLTGCAFVGAACSFCVLCVWPRLAARLCPPRCLLPRLCPRIFPHRLQRSQSSWLLTAVLLSLLLCSLLTAHALLFRPPIAIDSLLLNQTNASLQVQLDALAARAALPPNLQLRPPSQPALPVFAYASAVAAVAQPALSSSGGGGGGGGGDVPYRGLEWGVLDCRSSTASFEAGHIPLAQHMPWRRLAQGAGGAPQGAKALATALESTGLLNPVKVFEQAANQDSSPTASAWNEPSPSSSSSSASQSWLLRPVLVYGDWDRGSGEEGRMAWLLKYLGFQAVTVLYGGIRAWRDGKHPLHTGTGAAVAVTNGSLGGGLSPFALAPNTLFTMLQMEQALQANARIVAGSGEEGWILVDVRTQSEFASGHLPNAVHFDFRDAWAADGNLLSQTALAELLKRRGLEPLLPAGFEWGPGGGPGVVGEKKLSEEKQSVLYCVAGVRAGMFWTSLSWLGTARTANYAGSMAEWKANGKPLATSA